MIEHPFRPGTRLPVLALRDPDLDSKPEQLWNHTLFLDRTAREALGIADGEFCVAHPWLYPRRAVASRYLRDHYIGSRTISANVRTSARADLEKPVCRLANEALGTIGGAPTSS